jgi:predicted transcriptional regulator
LKGQPLSSRLDPETRRRLEAEAGAMDRPISWVATRAIEAYLAAREAERAAIEAALAEAERGVFVSGEAVEAWIESWGGDEVPMPPSAGSREVCP